MLPFLEEGLIPTSSGDMDFIRMMYDSFPLGVLITNLEGRVVYCNEAQARIDDMDRSYMINKMENELYGPYLGPGIIRSCQETGQPILGFVCHYRTVKGKIVNGAYWVYPLRKNGEVTGALCLTQMLSTKSPLFAAASDVENTGANNSKGAPLALGGETQEEDSTPVSIVGANLQFRKMLSVAQRTASSPSPVMICAETGCGKEVFVKAIRAAGNRCNGPYQAINCSAIPATLLEGILFGATRGSFTGAVERPGLLEEAHGGIVYLDEVDSMPLELQPKLLRVLQDMRVRRLGSPKERLIDVKVISSIGASPSEVMASGKLRADLFYRLAVISLTIPPLRHRMDDLDDLTSHFMAKYNKILNKQITSMDDSVKKLLCLYHWPGNVRELEHVIAGAINLTAWEKTLHLHHIPEHHRLALERLQTAGSGNYHQDWQQDFSTGNFAGSGFMQPSNRQFEQNYGHPFGPRSEHAPAQGHMQHPAHAPGFPQGRGLPLAALEAEGISEALRLTKGHVTRAAGILGISRQLLNYKMLKHGIQRSDFIL